MCLELGAAQSGRVGRRPMAGEAHRPPAPLWPEADVRLFISHDVEDHRDIASRIAVDVETLGAAAWLSSRDIPPGENWQANIERAFDESTHLVVLVGSSPPSKWVDEEIAMGRERMLQGTGEYPIIPVIVEAGGHLPRGLRRLQAVDVATSYSQGLLALATRLGLEAAMSGLQVRLLSEWDSGFSVLRRHADVLRRQLNRVALAVESEDLAVKRRAEEAEAASAEAEKLRRGALRLEARARNEAALADAADKRAQRMSTEYDRAQTTLSELRRRASEVEATHQPVLTKIDQAEQLLERARHDGPLSVDRGSDMVALLENPDQLAAPVNVTSRLTFKRFEQEYELRGVILRVVHEATQDVPELRDVVLGCCTEALGGDFQLSAFADAAAIKGLGEDLTEAIELYIERRRAGYDAVEALDIAVHDAFARLGSSSHSVMEQPSSTATRSAKKAHTPTKEPAGAQFEVLITAVPSAMDRGSRDGLAERIHAASRASPNASDIDGFFAARKAAAGDDLPVTIVRRVDEQTALRKAATLRDSGAEVLVRVVE